MDGGYRRLEVYRGAHSPAVSVHRMTLSLPRFEMYEEGSQVRRSSKRVSASIVEGHPLRRHRSLYLSYLYRALGSADETQEHLELLHKTGSLRDKGVYEQLHGEAAALSRRLTHYIQSVEEQHGKGLESASHADPEPEMDADPDEIAAAELKRRGVPTRSPASPARRDPGSGIRDRKPGSAR